MTRGSAASSALRSLAARSTDPTRFSRGKRYFRDGAVDDLEIEGLRVSAEVSGSRALPYRSTITCRSADSEVRAAFDAALERAGDLDEAIGAVVLDGYDLVPESISASCTCPDWEDVCKHAVALLFAFADDVASDPSRLLIWREIDVPAGVDRSVPGELREVERDERARLARAVLDQIARRRGQAASHGSWHEHDATKREAAASGADPFDDPFFAGTMPASGGALGGLALPELANPFKRGTVVVDGVDAGAVLHDVLEAVKAAATTA